MSVKEVEEYFFHHSVSLRITGEELNLLNISQSLNIRPSYTHKKGELSLLKIPYDNDMWLYDLPISKKESMDTQLKALWELFKPSTDFLLNLQKGARIDVYCSYESNSSSAGFGLSPQALEIFSTLKIFLEVSVIVSASELHQVLKEMS